MLATKLAILVIRATLVTVITLRQELLETLE